MTVGTELKKARENAGLSPEQISERTKIQLYKIDALENNTFELLPQGIYLDGIVRAYASEVALDPERMVERVRLERGKLPGDWEIPFAAPIDLNGTSTSRDVRFVEVPTKGDPLDTFATENKFATAPIARRAPLAPITPDTLHAPNAPNALKPLQTPYVPARPSRGHALLTLFVLGLLAAAGWGVYESNRALETDTTSDTVASAPRPASADDVVPNDMAELYAPAPPREARPTDVPAPFSDNATSSDAGPREPAPPARSTSGTAPSSSTHSRPVEPSTRAAAPARPESVGTSGTVQDVSGSWRLATHVESSSYSPYAGLQLGYEMKLEQEGDRVTGVGRKVTENGNGIGPQAQTPVTVSGTINGDRLTLSFLERGTERSTQGKFVLLVDEGGALRGRFSSNAAQSSGRVEAHRVSTQ